MIYRVFKQTHGQAVRWALRSVHPNGDETALGFYPTRKAAVTAGRLLAGRTGKVEVA